MKTIINATADFTGNILCLGVTDDKLLNSFNKLQGANIFMIDKAPKRKLFFKRSKVKTKEGKKINIKKLRKTFKNKSIDYIICDFNEMFDYFKYIIGDSVIINRKILYIYGESKHIEPNILADRYKRYGASVKVEIEYDKFIIIINNEKSKTNWFKNRFYVVVDTLHNIGDLISVALTS